MKTKTILRKNGTRKVSIDCSKPVLTDQSDKKSSDINTIMANYAKTGLLPVQQEKIAQYIDNTEIPSLEQAHDLIREAQEQFIALPSDIRKLMDNDPRKLQGFISNPENRTMLENYGILKKQVAPVPEEVSNPPSQNGAVESPQDEVQ
jgi:hypothetical protein